MTFGRAGDAAMEGGEAGFSGSPELLKSARRLNTVLVDQESLESNTHAYLNAFAWEALSFSFC